MTVVVTDHHLPGESLPPADAMVNPRLGDSPSGDLAGVGVAFLLAAAMNNILPGDKTDVRGFLDLVALGSIADVVPLSGLNRILVKNGLLLIAEAPRPGIAALKEASSYNPRAPLTAGQAAFGLAPRINAAGRMGEADAALELMLAPSLETARPIAARLDAMNTERRKVEDEIFTEAAEQAAEQKDRAALVLHSPDWHSGVVGIVASRLVEVYYRPVIVLCTEDGRLKGSGRSVSEVDLYSALAECAEHLERFGGHRQAAGMALSPENLKAFSDAFEAAVAGQTGGETLHASLFVDGELDFSEIDFTLLKELDLLQPFGMGNPEPVFVSPKVAVLDHRVFGKNHVKLSLRDEAAGVTLTAKAWRQAENMPADMRGRVLRVVFTPKIDYYGGVPTIDLNIKDWREDGVF
jgi:single-stranded-DNA-specific exonuclease